MKNKLHKQEKEKLDNRIVFLSSVIFLYAILLLFIQKMASSSMTVAGAFAFMEILRWVALGGSMLCAAWSAYKEKRSFFIYCSVCIFIFLSVTVFLKCNAHGRASLINYASLIAAFILIQLYYFIKVKGLFEKKAIRVGYVTLCLLAILAAVAASVMQLF